MAPTCCGCVAAPYLSVLLWSASSHHKLPSARRHFVAVALERTMRLSFREFHTQFDPTLRRERVPEALFELLGPPPSAKPVFEGKPLPAPKSDEQQEMTDAEQPVEAAAAQPNKTAAQPNGTPAPSADADAAVATETPAADATAADAPTAADSRDALEPVPDIAQQLYAQVVLLPSLLGLLGPASRPEGSAFHMSLLQSRVARVILCAAPPRPPPALHLWSL